jgi:hypothetical protein
MHFGFRRENEAAILTKVFFPSYASVAALLPGKDFVG